MLTRLFIPLICIGTASLLPSVAARSCQNAKQDCDDDQYCAANECLDYETCKTAIDCVNPSNKFISIDCVGHFNCLDSQCSQTCNCRDGSSPVACLIAPCQNGCDDADSCANDYCGGCNSINFDAGGNQICLPIKYCGGDEDCGGNQYCLENECRDKPTDCTEDPEARFIVKRRGKKNLKRKCEWITEQSAKRIRNYCRRMKGTKKRDPPKVACPITCGICEPDEDE